MRKRQSGYRGKKFHACFECCEKCLNLDPIYQQRAQPVLPLILQYSSAPDLFISKWEVFNKISIFMSNAIIMIVLMMIGLVLVSLNYTFWQVFHLLCWLSQILTRGAGSFNDSCLSKWQGLRSMLV